MAFYQKVNRPATNAKRRRSYAKLKYRTRQRELLQELKKTPGRQPRRATISKYGISWDDSRREWGLADTRHAEECVWPQDKMCACNRNDDL